jgi:hypothetical protein
MATLTHHHNNWMVKKGEREGRITVAPATCWGTKRVHPQLRCRHHIVRAVLRWRLRQEEALRHRDDNSGMGTQPDGYGYGDNFLSAGGIRTWSESRRVQDGYFFPPVGNPTDTRYFTTAIILGCEQVKMCSFCYVNYDLFWLLNFATLLSQIFVEY